MRDKIAVLGSAPSSLGLAPFNDETWEIWACSPACFSYVATRRCDEFFELHRWQPSLPGQAGLPGTKPWFSPEYHAFLREFAGKVWMSEPQPDIPNCNVMPYRELIERYGPYHFTSSLAWMMAAAIARKPKVIGVWGVDMAAQEEYAYQRPAMQHWVGLALAMGIQVVLPPESDLMRPTLMYGVGEHSERYIKWSARLAELKARLAQCDQVIEQHTRIKLATGGAIENMEYCIHEWADDVPANMEDFAANASAYATVMRGTLANPVLAPVVEVTKPKRGRPKGNGKMPAEMVPMAPIPIHVPGQ